MTFKSSFLVLTLGLTSLAVHAALTVSDFNIVSAGTSTNGTLSVAGTVSPVDNYRSAGGSWVISGLELDLLIGGNISPGLPNVDIQPTRENVGIGKNLWLLAEASGTPPFSYQWFKGGTNLVGQTNSALFLAKVTSNNGGNYNVIVTSPFGVVTSRVSTVAVIKKSPLTLTLTSPKAKAKVITPSLTIAGTVKSSTAVACVYYQLNGSDWTLASTRNQWTNWTSNVTLTPGANTINAVAIDASGNLANSKVISFTYVVFTPLVVLTNGNGSVSPAYNGKQLQIGNFYSLKAKPSRGYAFVNWTDGYGNVLAISATLKFQMKSNLTLIANFKSLNSPAIAGSTIIASAPELTLTHSGNNIVILWPSTLVGWTLEQNSDLTTTNWSVTAGVSDDGTNKSSTITPAPGSLFFRLSHP